jgi:hypothetical protein
MFGNLHEIKTADFGLSVHTSTSEHRGLSHDKVYLQAQVKFEGPGWRT